MMDEVQIFIMKYMIAEKAKGRDQISVAELSMAAGNNPEEIPAEQFEIFYKLTDKGIAVLKKQLSQLN
jgi:hypothetical protein